MRRLLLLGAIALVTVQPAAANHATIAEVKLNIGRMCANEAGFSFPQDCAAIWQTTVTIAGIYARRDDRRVPTPGDLLEAQQALSSRVTGAEPVTEVELDGLRDRGLLGNLTWSRNLTWSDHEPAGWDEGIPWEAVVSRWRNRREDAELFVRRFLQERRFPRQCRGTALGWGGPGLDDHHLEARNARRRAAGLRPFHVLNCGETRNSYFGHRPRTLSAS